MQAGLSDPVHQSQQNFREILRAMAEPGTIGALVGTHADMPLSRGSLAVLLTLVDRDTPLWLDKACNTAAVREYIGFHCGAPVVCGRQNAAFACLSDLGSLPHFTDFPLGTEEYPDRSCTVVVETSFQGDSYVLSGPGIPGTRTINLVLPSAFFSQRAALAEYAPRGLDFILVDGERMMALPRTTQVEAA